jgi:hypothetical protein
MAGRIFIHILGMVNNQLTSFKSPLGSEGMLGDAGTQDTNPLPDGKAKFRIFNTMIFPGRHDADHANMPDVLLYDGRGQEVTVEKEYFGVAPWGQWYDYILDHETANGGDIHSAQYVRFFHSK